MQLSNLIALASAIFSWQIAVLFLAFYIGLTRRQVHFLFALLSFALGMMAFCSFMSTSIVQPSAMLYWERAEHAVHFVTAGIFVHFVVTFMGQSLSLPVVSSMYVVCVGLGFLAFTPAFLHIGWVRAPGVSPHPVLRPGPLYPLMLWSFALLLMPAWVLIRQWTRQMERKDEEVESHAEGLEDAEATDGAVELMQSGELRLILTGSIAVVTLSWLDLGMAIADVSIPIRLHPLGALLLSILSAIAVGRRAIHAELERRELITLLRAREAAADDVAHEMKTPLTVIKGYALTLLRLPPGAVDETLVKESLQAIADEAERLTRMINNMLDIAKLEAGKPVTLRPQRVELRDLFGQLLERMQRLTDKHQLRLEWRAHQTEFVTDADKIYQIVLNLVDNAIKYSPDGGDVIVRVEDENDYLRISVIDQGIGMTPEQQARLFQRFERVVDPARKIMGTGIGLHLMKQLVEAMGGQIGVESQLGKGSTFWFTTPKELKVS